jgi:hypothetical protein
LQQLQCATPKLSPPFLWTDIWPFYGRNKHAIQLEQKYEEINEQKITSPTFCRVTAMFLQQYADRFEKPNESIGGR